MDVIFMRPITPLLRRVQRDFPNIAFSKGEDFSWSAARGVVTYRALKSNRDVAAFLHELAHAILGHTDFSSDIDLLSKEALTWQYAATLLGPKYGHQITQSSIDNELDSYRDWIHQRSLCPHCAQTGLQTQASHYRCINCNGSWRVNDARRCALRRYAAS